MATRVLRPALRLPILRNTTPTAPITAIPRLPIYNRPFSSSRSTQQPQKMDSADALIELAKNRRTIYQLGKNSPVPDAKIEELVNAAIQHIPSSFNTQSTRLVVLLHREHEILWDIVIDTFSQLVKSGTVPEETWKKQTLPKLLGMKGAVGTVSLRLGVSTEV